MTRPAPLVSVVLPTRNRAALLRDAVASALGQSYAHFELIVVDDGSEDETPAVVEAFADQRVRYERQPQNGRSAARNRGLARARGEYIAFLDDDDLFLPDKLARQVAFLERNEDVGLVAGGAQLIDASGRVTGARRPWLEQPELSLTRCLPACPLLTCAVLLRREWLDRLDAWFDPRLERAEDTDLWLRLLASGCRMAWDAEIVCAYRQHAESSQGDGDRYYESYLFMLDKLFSRADLPEEARAAQGQIFAHYHTLGACHAYRRGDVAAGGARLLAAARADPECLAGRPPRLADTIAQIAGSMEGANAPALIGFIFDNLPPELAGLRRDRRRALAGERMRRVFAASREGRAPHVDDWLRGTWGDPRWLRNRGVWSILVKDIALGARGRRESD